MPAGPGVASQIFEALSRAGCEGLPNEVMKLTDVTLTAIPYRAAYTVAFAECVYVLCVF